MVNVDLPVVVGLVIGFIGVALLSVLVASQRSQKHQQEHYAQVRAAQMALTDWYETALQRAAKNAAKQRQVAEMSKEVVREEKKKEKEQKAREAKREKTAAKHAATTKNAEIEELHKLVSVLKDQMGIYGDAEEVVRQAAIELGIEGASRPPREVAAECIDVLGL